MKEYTEQAEHPVVCVDAILLNEKDEILLTKRAIEPQKGWWSIIGERIKVSDDNTEAAVKRGVKEETGLEAEVVNLVDVLGDPRQKPAADPRFYVVQVVYTAKVIGGNLEVTPEADEFKWVSLDVSMKEKLAFNHNHILEIYKKKKEENKLIPAKRSVYTEYYGRKFDYEQDVFPRMAIGCIVLNEKNEIMLGLRSQWPFIDFWDFPGGHILVGESLQECMKREVKEEIGAEIEIGELFHVYSDKGYSPKNMDVAVFYFTKMLNQRFEKNIEIIESKFFPLTDLPDKISYQHSCCLNDLKKYLKI